MRMLDQKGTAAYRDTDELAWRHRAERPNAIWQTDHTELDILVLDANLKPGRPWLTTTMDDYSRAICSYVLFPWSTVGNQALGASPLRGRKALQFLKFALEAEHPRPRSPGLVCV